MKKNEQDIHIDKTETQAISKAHRFCHDAMAAAFEIFIVNNDFDYARQAARAAFDELDRLEVQLSRFVPNSDIARINNLQAGQTLNIGLDTFECLQLSELIYKQTDGAFDVTIGPLYNCWLDENKDIRSPSKIELDTARKSTGLNLITLDKEFYSITVRQPVLVDLGGIGKGFAIDKMAQILRQWSIDTALINAACSSILALDSPPDTNGWPVTISCRKPQERFYLHNRALSASGLRQGRHIIDPASAKPLENNRSSWVFAPDAATTDALSTAFMIISTNKIKQYCSKHPQVEVLLLEKGQKKDAVLQFAGSDRSPIQPF
jgi:thiamine biosynthesis lipoprotein